MQAKLQAAAPLESVPSKLQVPIQFCEMEE